METWHIALTIPQSDNFAAKSLSHRGYHVYRPIFPKPIRHFRNGPNKTRIVIRPLFPGYVFVSDPNHQGWGRLDKCPGLRPVDNLLKAPGPIGSHNEPTEFRYIIVPDHVMTRIRAKEQELCTQKLTLATSHGFKIGQQVRIEEGPFTGFLAQIEALDDHERIGLLMSMFGRESRVSLPAEQLASVS